MKTVFRDVTLCSSRKTRRFGGMCRLHLQGKNVCSSILTKLIYSKFLQAIFCNILARTWQKRLLPTALFLRYAGCRLWAAV
jgi:hypothetical protein